MTAAASVARPSPAGATARVVAVVEADARRPHAPTPTPFLSDLQRKPNRHAAPRPTQEARRLLPRPPPPQGVRVLRRQDRPDRLQGGQPPPPLPLGAGQDRAAPQDRHMRRSPA